MILAFASQPGDTTAVDGAEPIPLPDVPDNGAGGKGRPGGGGGEDAGGAIGTFILGAIKGPKEPNLSDMNEEARGWIQEHADRLWDILGTLIGNDPGRMAAFAEREGPKSSVFRKIQVRTEAIERLCRDGCRRAVAALEEFIWDTPGGVPNAKRLNEESRRWLEAQNGRLYSVLAAVSQDDKDVFKRYRKRIERRRSLTERIAARTDAIRAVVRVCVSQ